MTKSQILRYALVFFVSAFATHSLFAADVVQTHEGVSVSVSPRTAEQIEAFYSARGFPSAGLKALRQACFFTVGIHNASDDVVWLELKNFLMTDAAGANIARITRPQWKKRLIKLKVPLASQSAFGWTQLPEERDLQPDEPVGGNFAVARRTGPLNLTAEFRRGAKAALTFKFPNLRCAD